MERRRRLVTWCTLTCAVLLMKTEPAISSEHHPSRNAEHTPDMILGTTSDTKDYSSDSSSNNNNNNHQTSVATMTKTPTTSPAKLAEFSSPHSTFNDGSHSSSASTVAEATEDTNNSFTANSSTPFSISTQNSYTDSIPPSLNTTLSPTEFAGGYNSYNIVSVPQCMPQCGEEWPIEAFQMRTIRSCSTTRNFTLATKSRLWYSELCYCDSMCLLLGDCCYNYFPDIFGSTDVQEISRFIDTYLGKNGTDRDFRLLMHYGRCVDVDRRLPSTLMIAVCPEEFPDHFLRQKCENISMAAPFDIPVTHVWSENLIFSNIFCSRCHGIQDRDVVLWQSRGVCKNLSMEQFGSGTVDFQTIIQHCETFVTRVPASASHTQYRACASRGKKQIGHHRDLKLRLNRSSLVEETDFWCRRYIHPVEWTDKEKYVNPHCLLLARLHNDSVSLNDLVQAQHELWCTSLKDTDPLFGGLPSIPSFSMMFALSSTNSRPTIKVSGQVLRPNDAQCSEDEVFDTYLLKCHKIHCCSGTRLVNGSCRVQDNFEVDVRTQLIPDGSRNYSIQFVTKSKEKPDANRSLSFLQVVQTCLAEIDLEHEFPEAVHQIDFKIIEASDLVLSRFHGNSTFSSSDSYSDDLEDDELCVLEPTEQPVQPESASHHHTLPETSPLAVEVSFRSTVSLDLVFRVATLLASQYKACGEAAPSNVYLTNAASLQNVTCPLGERRVLRDVDMVLLEGGVSLMHLVNGSQLFLKMSHVPFVHELTGLIPSRVDKATVCFPPDCVLVRYPVTDADALLDKLKDLSVLLKVDERFLWKYNDAVYVCAEHAQTIRHERVLGHLEHLRQRLSSYGLLFSNICMALTFLLYAALRPLRNQHGQKVMCMTGSCLLAAMAFWFSNIADDVGCQIVAVLIHFFFLSAFLWMSVVSFDLASTFSHTLPISGTHQQCCSNRLLKEAAVCYLIPGMLVTSFIGIHLTPELSGYVHYGRTVSEGCGLTTDIAVIIGILVPIGASLLFNLGCFFVTLVGIERKRMRKAPVNAGRKETSRGSCYHGVLYLKLSFIMGLPWLLSYLAETLQVQSLLLVGTVCNSLQGVIIFLVFACNRNVYRAMEATAKAARIRCKRRKVRSLYRLDFLRHPTQCTQSQRL